MPVNTVKWNMWLIEFRGKRRVGVNQRLSPGLYLHSGLTGGEWLAGCGSQLALSSSPWKTQPAQTPDCGMEGREGEISSAANRRISLDQIFGVANTHF